MAGPASKRPYSPDKPKKPMDPSGPDGKLPGENTNDRASTARRGSSENKKRTKAHHERQQSNLEDISSANQAATHPTSTDFAHMFAHQPKASIQKRKTSPPTSLGSESKGSSINSGMKTGSSFLTTPEDSGFQVQDDVSALRAWWATIRSKPTTGCGNCGSTSVLENVTTDYVRMQLDAEYGITHFVKAAERLEREKKAKKEELREEAFARSRWGKGKKLGDDKDDKEREKALSPSPRGKEKAGEIKKLGRLLGTNFCPGCDHCICLGCLKPLGDSQVATVDFSPDKGASDTAKIPKTKRSHLKRDELWCCNEGRVVAMFLMLACVDEETLDLSLIDDQSSINFPNTKGFGGAVKRGIRTLKDKITENTSQKSPSFKGKLKSKSPKGSGTGYGSGGYNTSGAFFPFMTIDDEGFDDDTSDSDDPSGLSFPPPYSDVTSYSSPLPPATPAQPSGYFSGLGHKLGDGTGTSTDENNPLQIIEPPNPTSADLIMEDLLPPSFPGIAGSSGRGGRGGSYMNSPSPWRGHPSFGSRGRGISTRGRGGVHPFHMYFSTPGQTLGGPVAGSTPKPEPLPITNGTPPVIPEEWPLSMFPNMPHFQPPLPHPQLDPVFLGLPNQNPGEQVYQQPPPWPVFSPLPPFTGAGALPKPRSNPRSKSIQAIPSSPPLSAEQTRHDKTLAAVMELLTDLIPDPAWDSIFEPIPSPPLDIMLRVSMLVEKTEELLRNDSIQDISIHSEIYLALMKLLRRICACSNLEFLVMGQRRKKVHTLGILKIAQSLPVPDDIQASGPKTRGKMAAAAEERKRAEVLTYEDSPDRKPLVEVSENLCKQAKVFLKGAEKAEGVEFDGPEATKILGICTEIVGIKEEFEKIALKTSLPNMDSAPEEIPSEKGKHFASPISPRKKVVPPQLRFTYHKRLAYEYTENVLSTHHYRTQAQGLSESPRGRVLHITRELASVSTSLPQGIFVRVEDSRPDVLKALIVGPGGTPYEGGLYEFDLWAPMEYPISPPLCIFKTTGGGSVHFNPNLYNCGKVCLSILNTWEGAASEKWQPGISTLLQVFVSIQSMILCDNPWYNEPGRREGTQKKQSEEFNTKVRLNNVRFAMLDWVKDPEKRNGIWKNVIQAHFSENKSYVIDLIKGWAKKDPTINNWRSGMGTVYGAPFFTSPEDFMGTLIPAGRRLVGEDVPVAPPASMDMVAEMERLLAELSAEF